MFRQTIERWQKSIGLTENKLYSEIENRRVEYKARLDKALDCQSYLQIGKDLKDVADSIKNVYQANTSINKTQTDVKDAKTYCISINKSLLSMYKLSNWLRIKIQTGTYSCFISKATANIIVGWDENCESKFMYYAFNKTINPKYIKVGRNSVGNTTNLFHRQSQPIPTIVGNKNVYVLVNATQFGAAMNELSRLKLPLSVTRSDHVYFVVQDFQEIMNGGSVLETLTNILSIKEYQDAKVTCPCNVLLLHDNPLYNLAATEAQTTGCTKQYDEIRILNSLQTKFGFLFPKDRTSRNIVETTIRQIIQKLGKI